jgi:hypothetical protein
MRIVLLFTAATTTNNNINNYNPIIIGSLNIIYVGRSVSIVRSRTQATEFSFFKYK